MFRGPSGRGLWLAAWVFVVAGQCAGASVSYQWKRAAGVGLHVVVVDLNDRQVKVTPLLTARYPGGAEPARALVRRYWPAAAITGTMFSIASRLPIGDIVIDGRLRHFGGMGTALAITGDNQVAFIQVPYGRHVDWSGFETVLACGPRLVRLGRVHVRPWEEGFTSPSLFRPARRCAVGLTRHNKLLLVATNQLVTLSQLARALVELGCIEAINLDGGTSAALYYRGRWLVKPGRALVNMLAVFEGVPVKYRLAAKPSRKQVLALVRWRKARAHELFQAAKQERGEEALNLLVRACELDPDMACYRLELAKAFQRMGQRGAAATWYAKASCVYLSKGLVGQAESTARRALELAPMRPDVLNQMAAVERARGEYGVAWAYRRKARLASLLEALPTASQRAASEIVQRLADLAGAAAPEQPRLAGHITPRGYVDERLGLYITLPEGWSFWPTQQPNGLVAVNAARQWLAHVAVLAVPAQADLRICAQELIGPAWWRTEPAQWSRLGLLRAVDVRATFVARGEIAAAWLRVAKRSDRLLAIAMLSYTAAAHNAGREFERLCAGVAFRRH